CGHALTSSHSADKDWSTAGNRPPPPRRPPTPYRSRVVVLQAVAARRQAPWPSHAGGNDEGPPVSKVPYSKRPTCQHQTRGRPRFLGPLYLLGHAARSLPFPFAYACDAGAVAACARTRAATRRDERKGAAAMGALLSGRLSGG